MSRKLILLTLIVSLLSLPLMAFDWSPPDPDGPVPICSASASNPYKSGSNVKGTGTVTCVDPQPKLIVNVDLVDWTNRTASASKTCYNTTSCSATATLSYSSGRQWQTRVSGYANNNWNGYAQSSWIAIP